MLWVLSNSSSNPPSKGVSRTSCVLIRVDIKEYPHDMAESRALRHESGHCHLVAITCNSSGVSSSSCTNGASRCNVSSFHCSTISSSLTPLVTSPELRSVCGRAVGSQSLSATADQRLREGIMNFNCETGRQQDASPVSGACRIISGSRAGHQSCIAQVSCCVIMSRVLHRSSRKRR